MTKNKKIGLGVLTFLPLICILLYFVVFFGTFFTTMSSVANIENGTPPNPSMFMSGFVFLFLLIIVAIISGISIMIYYVIHANKNPKNIGDRKLMWILILVLSGMIGSLVYFFVEIVPLKPTDEPLPS